MTSEEGFRVPDVCRIVGISYRQLDYWARTELVTPSIRESIYDEWYEAGIVPHDFYLKLGELGRIIDIWDGDAVELFIEANTPGRPLLQWLIAPDGVPKSVPNPIEQARHQAPPDPVCERRAHHRRRDQGHGDPRGGL